MGASKNSVPRARSRPAAPFCLYAATRDFLCIDSCPSAEKELVAITKRILREAGSLPMTDPQGSLLKRLREWIDFSSDADEMPPISADD